MLGYNPNVGIGFNPEQAKRWLAEAGYQNGEGFPKAVFMYPDRESNRLVAETIQSLWKKYLGVEVQLENQEWKV
ncbi:peptide ABC transporter substrate-binding protein, partial [bacterium]|nr:peptide ABC transporter substrate-binding protein [bacterium]